jgi:hypothetical protein
MHNLNHPKVKPLTPAIASQLQLDPTFVNFVFAEERPECFRYWCEDAKYGWTCHVPDAVEHAYVLWSCNSDQTLLLVSGGELIYAKGYHDDPEITLISQTSQGLLANLLNEAYETEATRDEIIDAAKLSGFRFVNEYLAFAESSLADRANWANRWRQFIDGIDAMSISLHLR